MDNVRREVETMCLGYQIDVGNTKTTVKLIKVKFNLNVFCS